MVDENLRDLRERLSYIASGQAGPLLIVVGSGVSRGAVATTSEMTDRFLEVLSDYVADGLKAQWGATTADYVKYQQAATAVSRQRGDRALTGTIRAAVLAAVEGQWHEGDDVRAAVRERDWKVPKAHRDLAEFYSRLPAELRGPIITTNFDPLIEVALRERGFAADPVPVSFDDPPNMAYLRNASSVPVIHIHGYFAETWSLNSINQISAPRAKLEALLESLFLDANILVLGYGGWEDSFMRVLSRHAASPSVMGAEVVWCAHSPNVSELTNSVQKLSGMPGFGLYTGIDASTLFDAPIGLRAQQPSRSTPRGWTVLPVAIDEYRAPHQFFEGASASWSDGVVGRWPMLETAREFYAEAMRVVDGVASHGMVAAIGPIGEGKSMALLQVAMKLADETDWNVVWQSAGAPSLTEKWMREERETLGNCIFCIDEADLARGDIELLLSSTGGVRTLILSASQDRLWWSLPPGITSLATPVVFDGLAPGDADALAESWRNFDIEITRSAPGKGRQLTTSEVRDELIAHSKAQKNQARTTLFGAILGVHESSTLSRRVDELMDRLDRAPARPGMLLTLADVFGAICLIQMALDRNGAYLRGATREFVGEMVNVDDSLENAAVLNALGREASITFAGRHVYSRHPAIAKLVVSWLQAQGRLSLTAERCGQVGGRLRVKGAQRVDYESAYFLGKNLEVPALALSACAGAIKGAPGLLEPRITYISVARRSDTAQALKYALGIVPLLTTANDARSGLRVYLNELALVELHENHARLALGVAALVLHNGSGTGATREQMQYGIGTLAKAYKALMNQDACQYTQGLVALRRVARLLMDEAQFRKFVDIVIPARIGEEETENLPLMAALNRLAREISPLSRDALMQLGLPFTSSGARGKFSFRGGLDFSELHHYEIR